VPPTADPSSFANDGARKNLFVEADPEYDELSTLPPGSSPAMDSRRASGFRRGRSLVVPVDESSKASAARADAARFTRGHTAFGRPRPFVEHKLRYRDREVGGVLRRLASRRYGALAVATILGGLLIALIWLGLASCAAFTAPVAGEQHPVRGTVVLRADRARIDTLVTRPASGSTRRAVAGGHHGAPDSRRGDARGGKPDVAVTEISVTSRPQDPERPPR